LPRRGRIPEGKVRLEVLIREDLYDMLVRLAPQIAGPKYRGALSRVVEEALKQYLYPRARAQTPGLNPRLTVRDVYDQVKRRLADMTGIPWWELREVKEAELDRAIAEVRGSDPRTIAKWKKLFQASGLIKILSGQPGRRIVELIG